MRSSESGVRVWCDVHDMGWGRELKGQIDRAIDVHDRLLLVLSDNSMNSQWVRGEIRRARQRERETKRRILFPISLVPHDRLRAWSLIDPDTGEDLADESEAGV